MLSRTPLLIEGQRREPGEPLSGREKRREKSGRGSRVLYHIGKAPPFPRPAQTTHARVTGRKRSEGPDTTPEGSWIRKGREPTSSGVFLTNNPRRTARTQVAANHVFAYKVPEHVIKKSGGIRTYDGGTELLVPHEHWHHVEPLGKSKNKSEFAQEVKRTVPAHIRAAGDFAKMDREDREAGEDKWRSWADDEKDKRAQETKERREHEAWQEGQRKDERQEEKAKRQGERMLRHAEKKAHKREQRRERKQRRKKLVAWTELRTPLLREALQVRRQSDKERMAKKRPSATFAAARSSKWLWQQIRKKWSKDHPQYIFRKGRLIFVPPEKRRQLKSKIKGRVVLRAKTPGSGHKG